MTVVEFTPSMTEIFAKTGVYKVRFRTQAKMLTTYRFVLTFPTTFNVVAGTTCTATGLDNGAIRSTWLNTAA